MKVCVNPGSGPVTGRTNIRSACRNVRVFADDVRSLGVPVRKLTVVGRLDEGRLRAFLRSGRRTVEIEMPGLPIDRVRWLSSKQDIWQFPRLYVNSGSWVWKFAVDIAAFELSGRTDCQPGFDFTGGK